MNRRQFVLSTAFSSCAVSMFSRVVGANESSTRFSFALGQWTFQKTFRGLDSAPKRSSVEFPTMAGELGFTGVDYSGILIGDDYTKTSYLAELNRRAGDAGVKNVLILVDLQEALGAKDPEKRKANVERYRPWLDTAATLGCMGIRVNPISDESEDAIEQSKLLADGLAQLVTYSDPLNLDVMIENHGEGLRCNGVWLASVVKRVSHARCGTLPDFSNFLKNRKTGELYDRYQGVAAMLPFAKSVCAKSHDFDAEGNECYSDYDRLMELVVDSGYQGWIEIEYEGPGGSTNPRRKPAEPLSEGQGAIATRRLIERSLAHLVE